MKSKHRTKSFTFKMKSKNEFLEWTNRISFYIHKNKLNNWDTITPEISIFWKYRTMFVDNFKSKALSGDILLFEGSQVISKIQRTFTRSRFGNFYT